MNFLREILAMLRTKKNLVNMWRWIRSYVLGYKPNSEPGSNIRRSFSRLLLLLSILIPLQAIFVPVFFEEHRLLNRLYSYYFFLLCIFFFISNVVAVTFSSDAKFEVNTSRLFFDIIISAIFHIVSFSYLYRLWGIIDPSQEITSSINFWDHLYFSSVTFSTLGYGDFRPSGDSRLIAAYQALIGNMHIGFLVGAAYLAASTGRSASK